MPTPQNPERKPTSRPEKESHSPRTALTNALSDLRKTPTFRFFGLAFLAYVVWSVAYEEVLKPRTTLDEVVIEHMVSSTEAAFEAIGWPAGTYPQPASHRDRVGVLAGLLELLRKDELNVQEMENLVFPGGAAIARIQITGDHSPGLMERLADAEHVLHASIVAISE